MKLEELLEKTAPLPWKLQGHFILDGTGKNEIAFTAEGWSDDGPNAQYLVHAANVLPAILKAAKELTNAVPVMGHDELLAAIKRIQPMLLAAVERADEVTCGTH